MTKPFKTLRCIHNVPIYDAEVRLIVATDIAAERRKLESIFGPATVTDYHALCSHDLDRFALFFQADILSPKIIAHEGSR